MITPGGRERGAMTRGRFRHSPRRWLADRPRLTLLLIGGGALGGIVCMCLAVALVALARR